MGIKASQIAESKAPDSVKLAQLREAIEGHMRQLDLLRALVAAIEAYPSIEPYVKN